MAEKEIRSSVTGLVKTFLFALPGILLTVANGIFFVGSIFIADASLLAAIFSFLTASAVVATTAVSVPGLASIKLSGAWQLLFGLLIISFFIGVLGVGIDNNITATVPMPLYHLSYFGVTLVSIVYCWVLVKSMLED